MAKKKSKELVKTESNNEIGSMVRRLESAYVSGYTQNSKYVQQSMYEDLCKIDAYLSSKHTTGDTDSMGRDKPFFNIVTAAVNIWYRATDIDRKNINIRPTQTSDILAAFIATVFLQQWMREENFGMFLNDWGRSLARYGSSVVKFVEQGGKLHSIVVPWNRLIVDPVNFEGNVKIEVLEMTEAELKRRKGYDKEAVKALCDAVNESRKNLDGSNKDQQRNDYIRLYEIHGELPLSHLTDDENDEDTYRQQMHVVSFVAKKGKDDEYDDFTLVRGREKKDPYMLTHLIKEDGQTLSIGAVAHLFEAQWMMNHTVKAIKDQLDLASKLVFITTDANFAGQNALGDIESGDILFHAENTTFTSLNNESHDITSLQNFGSQWKALSNEITGISESMLGENPPSGQAWRQTNALLQESHSLFELMTENKGLYIEQMLREFVIPFVKKQMDSKKEISAVLSDNHITMIDKMYIPAEAARRIQKKVIAALTKGELPQNLDHATEQAGVANDLQALGNTRYFTPDDLGELSWADVLDGLEWRVECEITDEASDKQANLATLTTVLQTIATNPAILQNPQAAMVFNKILSQTGQVSPVELPPPPPPAPTQIQPQQTNQTQPPTPQAPATAQTGT